MFKRGRIVLVPFPFTDLSAQKVRPAIIISNPTYSPTDVTVVFVSSVIPKSPKKTDVILKENTTDLIKSGLKKASVIRCNKLATLDKKIVLGEIGATSPAILKKISAKLRLYLALR